jgi:serine phosphatase RsbU (regulator of sigma subunit)
MEKIVASNFDERNEIFLVEDNSEIAALSNNIDQMHKKMLKLKTDIFAQKQILENQNFQLIEHRSFLDETLNQLEFKNKKITDSINYAQKIQNALLHKYDNFGDFHDKNFIMYMPKDIVSGDFYTSFNCKNLQYIVLMDCTGHGVPGAFMTILGAMLLENLNSSLKECLQPQEVLDLFDREFKNLLKSKTNYISDAMDMAVVSWDKRLGILKYSGAKMPFFYMKSGVINYQKASKKTIGDFGRRDESFETIEIFLEKGDRFYLFTDGYKDQFGGSDNKKMSRRLMTDFILESQNLSIIGQGEFMKESFLKWKDLNEQTDDVTLLGFEV